jgi:hypothetical protein
MADNRADVEAILEIPERTGVSIDDGDLVSLFAMWWDTACLRRCVVYISSRFA